MGSDWWNDVTFLHWFFCFKRVERALEMLYDDGNRTQTYRHIFNERHFLNKQLADEVEENRFHIETSLLSRRHSSYNCDFLVLVMRVTQQCHHSDPNTNTRLIKTSFYITRHELEPALYNARQRHFFCVVDVTAITCFAFLFLVHHFLVMLTTFEYSGCRACFMGEVASAWPDAFVIAVIFQRPNATGLGCKH